MRKKNFRYGLKGHMIVKSTRRKKPKIQKKSEDFWKQTEYSPPVKIKHSNH